MDEENGTFDNVENSDDIEINLKKCRNKGIDFNIFMENVSTDTEQGDISSWFKIKFRTIQMKKMQMKKI